MERITEYSPDEFERVLKLRGACGKRQAREERERLGKSVYTEDDVIDVFRKYNDRKMGERDYGHTGDWEYAPNSCPDKKWILDKIYSEKWMDDYE